MENKICIACNKVFIPNYRKSQNFCNRKCYHKYWRDNNDIKVLNIKKRYYQKNKHKIYLKNKEFANANPERVKKSKERYKFMHRNEIRFRNKLSRLSNPIESKARNLAQKKIKLKDSCEICYSKEKLERHHWRYDKPLLVNTLCKSCHLVQHA